MQNVSNIFRSLNTESGQVRMNACSVCKSCDAKLSGVSSRLASGISTEALLSSYHPLNAEKVSTPVCCIYVRLADI